MHKKVKIGLIFGGRSGEHEVSLQSAQGVMGAIDREKYEIVPIGITQEGRWLAAGDPMKALTSGEVAQSNPAALLAEPSQRGLMRLETQGQEQALKAIEVSQIDVAFPILHGPYGEDGTVQGLLELAGIPYVGAGVLASAVGMDKVVFKDVARAHGLSVPAFVAVKRKEWDREPEQVVARAEAELGYPCFVKPANLGSSVGISKAHNRAELRQALAEAARYDRKLLVEEAIDAREIEVSVLGNDEPIASVPGEILPSAEFYDYAAKYLDAESELLIPAPIPPEMAERIRELAVKAYLAIDCAGMARVDFLLDRQTNEVYLNEVNTLPGFTPVSMYPKLWEATGISYPELIERLVELALERHADKSRSATSYEAPEER
ncbi:MAG: D-alanine--D-alanine ligase [Anaerolineae bacterium]|jgi:D-alanine-D-alanine ligase|nr:D-alanine--D-alanine ligase [Anaerolineae bacterium]